ncbi:PilZ domain-containing protein [Chitinimonas sp. BJYL2]|uniref:PilZ domain-containing protein n=1 Tax=Chitinimonas sp. BJYL2 TaxID=2976696 RepID=UPI0022B37C14|nr:PilZ domain-containing protein [Chitinimonas sp. BJYL2]
MSQDKRAALRIPVSCPARIRTADIGPAFYGTCTDLSVTGLTIQSNFVPRHDELLEVTVMPPRTAKQAPVPMVIRARVRRCHELEPGVSYEIGLAIVEILA